VKIYRMETLKNANEDAGSVTRTEPTKYLDPLILKALVYGTWRAWWTGVVWDAAQPVLWEADADPDAPDGVEYGWTEIPTDDARVMAFFDCPDVDEVERSIVVALQSFPYGLQPDVAEEALAMVEQYDGYKVQTLVPVATDEERSNGPWAVAS